MNNYHQMETTRMKQISNYKLTQYISMPTLKSILFVPMVISIINSTIVLLDREFTTQYFTDADTSSWTITGATVPTQHLQYTCNGDLIFGGYNLFTGDTGSNPTKISKTFSGLPPHWSAQILAKIYKIDSWKNQSLIISVDSSPIQMYTWNSSTGTSDICGTPNPVIDATNTNFYDTSFNMNQNISHSSSTLTLTISSTLGEPSGQYWGIRDLYIYLALCDPSCLSCTNDSVCTSCPTVTNVLSTSLGAGQYSCSCSSGLQEEIINCMSSTCISCPAACDPGFYQTGATCTSCATGCGICTGNDASSANCTSCSVGYYFSNSNPANVCVNCDPTCYTCTTTSTNCLSCSGVYFLTGTSCLTSCPSGFYATESSNSCNSCSANCLTCFSSTSTGCLSCSASYFLIVSNNSCALTCPTGYYAYQNSCYDTCPSATYPSSSTCTACLSNCITCTTNSDCSACATNYYLSNNTCLGSCASGYYFQVSNSTCTACFSGCAACTSYTYNTCTSCTGGLTISSNICSSSCATGTYLNVSTGTCNGCDPSCTACSNGLPTGCLSCSNANYFNLNLSTCVNICDPSYAIDTNTMQCWQCATSQMSAYGNACYLCDSSCSQCTGTDYYSCASCSSDRYLTHGMCLCNKNTPSDLLTSCKSDNSSFNIYLILYYGFLFNVILCLILEILFKHQTNLLLSLELFQILSMMYFINIPYPYTFDLIYPSIYKSHISTLFSPAFQDSDGMTTRLIGRQAMMGGSSYFIYDGQIIIAGYIALVALYFIFKIMKGSSEINSSIFNVSRYLVDKTEDGIRLWFRLTVMQMFYTISLNLNNFSWGNDQDSASLIAMIVPFMVVCSLLTIRKWSTIYKSEQIFLVYSIEFDYNNKQPQKQKEPKLQETIQVQEINNTKQEFLFMEQEVKRNQSQVGIKDIDADNNIYKLNITRKSSVQENQPKKLQEILQQPQPQDQLYFVPMFVPILKAVIPVVLVFASTTGGQILSMLVISVLLGLSYCTGRYRRKIYRVNSIVIGSIVLVSSCLILCMYYLDNLFFGSILLYLWTCTVIYLLVVTLVQLITNITVIPDIICKCPDKINHELHRSEDYTVDRVKEDKQGDFKL